MPNNVKGKRNRIHLIVLETAICVLSGMERYSVDPVAKSVIFEAYGYRPQYGFQHGAALNQLQSDLD